MSETPAETEATVERCLLHPEAVAVARCVGCERAVCVQCLSRDEDGLVQCTQCAEGVQIDLAYLFAQRSKEEAVAGEAATKETGESPVVVDDVVPWEAPRTTSDTQAFGRTTIEALLSPNRYMSRIPWVRGELQNPLMYGLVAGCIGQLASILQLVANPELLQIPGLTLSDTALTGFLLLSLPLMPLLLVVGLFVKSWLAHKLMGFMGERRNPFEATFRVFCYAEAAAVLLLVPIAGPYAAMFFSVFLLLTGLRHAQGAGFLTSIVALAPVLLFGSLLR